MARKNSRSEADHKKFGLYEVLTDKNLKYVGEVHGFNGADAHLRAVREGAAHAGIAYVTLSDRNLGVNIVEETAPATPRLKISNVSGGRAGIVKKTAKKGGRPKGSTKAKAPAAPAAPAAPVAPGSNPFAE